MRRDYIDVLEEAGEPLWYDDAGAPRYCRFSPGKCDVYASEVEYLEVACQECGQRFKVARSFRPAYIADASSYDPDPPRHSCVGDTMTGDLIRIVSHWQRTGAAQWEKVS